MIEPAGVTLVKVKTGTLSARTFTVLVVLVELPTESVANKVTLYDPAPEVSSSSLLTLKVIGVEKSVADTPAK
jgi:hypothetical protein